MPSSVWRSALRGAGLNPMEIPMDADARPEPLLLPVQGSLSVEDYAAAIRLHSRPSGLGKLLQPTVFLLLFLALVVQPVVRGASLLIPVTAMVALVVVVFFLRTAPERAAKAALRNPVAAAPILITLSEDGFKSASQYGTSTLPWGAFVQRRQSDSLFLLYQADSLFHVLPRRWCTSDKQWQEVIQLVSGHVPETPRRSGRDVLFLVLLWIVLMAGVVAAFLQGAMVR